MRPIVTGYFLGREYLSVSPIDEKKTSPSWTTTISPRGIILVTTEFPHGSITSRPKQARAARPAEPRHLLFSIIGCDSSSSSSRRRRQDSNMFTNHPNHQRGRVDSTTTHQVASFTVKTRDKHSSNRPSHKQPNPSAPRTPLPLSPSAQPKPQTEAQTGGPPATGPLLVPLPLPLPPWTPSPSPARKSRQTSPAAAPHTTTPTTSATSPPSPSEKSLLLLPLLPQRNSPAAAASSSGNSSPSRGTRTSF